MVYRKLLIAVVVFFIFPGQGKAFLSSHDPQNFFALVGQAPLMVVAKIKDRQAPTAGQRYYLHTLQVQKILSGKLSDKTLKVFQEQVFSKDRSIFPNEGTVLVFLTDLPKYTAYQPARSKGARYRVLGGAKGALPWDETVSTMVQKTLDLTSLEEKQALFLTALDSTNQRLREDGALALAKLALRAGSLDGPAQEKILQALQSLDFGKEAQQALVQALQKSHGVATLTKIADGPPSPAKWAAVRALKKLGQPRSTQALVRDFENSEVKEKPKVLALIVQKQDGAAKRFLQSLLSGSEPYELKREAVLKMSQQGGAAYEEVLLSEIANPDEKLSVQVMLGLSKMKSRKSVAQLLPYLDSDSETLRSAAIMSLYLNQDPQAQKEFRKRFSLDSHGHLHPKKHFHKVPGVDSSHSHSQGSDHKHSH